MNKVLGALKKIFPVPTIPIPQKRYLVMILLASYYGLSAYTNLTTTQDDDHWPDKMRDVVTWVFGVDLPID